eukprot:gene433-548_t
MNIYHDTDIYSFTKIPNLEPKIDEKGNKHYVEGTYKPGEFLRTTIVQNDIYPFVEGEQLLGYWPAAKLEYISVYNFQNDNCYGSTKNSYQAFASGQCLNSTKYYCDTDTIKIHQYFDSNCEGKYKTSTVPLNTCSEGIGTSNYQYYECSSSQPTPPKDSVVTLTYQGGCNRSTKTLLSLSATFTNACFQSNSEDIWFIYSCNSTNYIVQEYSLSSSSASSCYTGSGSGNSGCNTDSGAGSGTSASSSSLPTSNGGTHGGEGSHTGSGASVSSSFPTSNGGTHGGEGSHTGTVTSASSSFISSCYTGSGSGNSGCNTDSGAGSGTSASSSLPTSNSGTHGGEGSHTGTGSSASSSLPTSNGGTHGGEGSHTGSGASASSSLPTSNGGTHGGEGSHTGTGNSGNSGTSSGSGFGGQYNIGVVKAKSEHKSIIDILNNKENKGFDQCYGTNIKTDINELGHTCTSTTTEIISCYN